MTYPSAPWRLKGFAVQTLHLVDSAQARSFVPPELDIVSVLPGKTLGVMYLASYEPGYFDKHNCEGPDSRVQGTIRPCRSGLSVNTARSAAIEQVVLADPPESGRFDNRDALEGHSDLSAALGGRLNSALGELFKHFALAMPLS